jgi:ethanolamine transporter
LQRQYRSAKVFHLTRPYCHQQYGNRDGRYQNGFKDCLSHEMGLFSGIIIASSLGHHYLYQTIAISMLSHEDEEYFYKGVMIGIVSLL